MLPTNTSGGIGGGGNFFKASAGNNKILILGEAIEAYQYWTDQMRPVVQREKFEEPLPSDARQNEKRDKDGNVVVGADGKPEMVAARQQYFWVMPIYNFTTKSVEVWQVTQKGIRDELVAIQSNEDWRSPVGTYSITIHKEGEMLKTKYKVTPNPINDKNKKEIDEIMGEYKTNPLDVEAIVFKD
jgi:hypothetical protein